jgi:hypothetical protein
MKNLERICAGCDMAIFITRHDTALCAELLAVIRAPGWLSSNAATVFESGWRMYLARYAAAGGPIGILIHNKMRERGPVLAMGESTEVGRITELLTLKARTITRSEFTPLIVDAVFETTARNVAAELSATVGCA